MKKKIFIGITMSLFAVATVFNVKLAEQGNTGDVSLEIMMKAQASVDPEAPIGHGYQGNCPKARFSCSAGGPGSSECSVTVDTVAGGVTYSVKCRSACYACCNGMPGGGARCFEDK